MRQITMTPIGIVRSTRKAVEDDKWDSEKASIELDALQFSADALAGLNFEPTGADRIAPAPAPSGSVFLVNRSITIRP